MKAFISQWDPPPHFQLFYFNDRLEFCDFFEWKIKRINNADLFSQPPLVIFTKGANISGGHCILFYNTRHYIFTYIHIYWSKNQLCHHKYILYDIYFLLYFWSSKCSIGEKRLQKQILPTSKFQIVVYIYGFTHHFRLRKKHAIVRRVFLVCSTNIPFEPAFILEAHTWYLKMLRCFGTELFTVTWKASGVFIKCKVFYCNMKNTGYMILV